MTVLHSDSASSEFMRRPLLQGVRVCILRSHDYWRDSRVRKQATTLTDAGARVSLFGVGTRIANDLLGNAWDVTMLAPDYPNPVERLPRLGREEVWWPLRVAVNLTYTRARDWAYRNSAPTNENEPLLRDAASRSGPDIVHAYDIYTLPAAIRVKEATGAKVIYDVRDLYTDVDYVDSRRKRRLVAAEKRCIGRADAVITVSEALADVLSSRYPIARPVAVYNGPIEVVSQVSQVSTPIKLLFQGAFAEHRNLGALVAAMDEFRGRATLTLQGFGGVEGELRQQVEARGLEECVSFVAPVAPRDVVASASKYDLGVICHIGTNVNMSSAVPNKLMDYLGAGLGIVASDLTGHRSVLDGTGAAVFLDPSTPASIALGLRGLIDEPDRIVSMKRAAVMAAHRFEWSLQAERMLEVYESVIRAT